MPLSDKVESLVFHQQGEGDGTRLYEYQNPIEYKCGVRACSSQISSDNPA